MRTIVLEIRDEGTFIPVMATVMSSTEESEAYLLKRAGFIVNARNVHLCKLTTLEANFSPSSWGSRTMSIAHKYIEYRFHLLKSGDVVDVQYITGETENPKQSERLLQ